MSQPTWWNRVRSGSKKGFDQAWSAVDKLGAPVNKLTNKLGSEAFWPTTLDKESDKAARILKSFCKDGFYAEEERQPVDGPKQKQKVVKKIPAKVIQNAKGLAIFTTMRTGLWMSGAGGSGILVARLPDGSWSPPSGILLHTAGLGFLVGVDIYDCVVVINSEKALEAFTNIRCTLGGEISVVAGPVGAGGILETELHKRQAPVFTYMKSRGFYAGVQVDGTVIIERTDENERFYGERIPVRDIIAGKVRHPPYELRRLMETIKAAQGDTNFDESALPEGPPPGDYVVDDGHMFGVPEKDDPDPYGVLALEKEGLSLKVAGTQKRASWEEFNFHPSPTSPIHAVYAQSSQERAVSRRNSWRASVPANERKRPSSLRNSTDLAAMTPMVNTSTQTDFPADPPSPSRWSVRSGVSRHSSLGTGRPDSQMPEVPEHQALDTSPERREPRNASKTNGYSTPPHTPPLDGVHEEAAEHDEDHDDHDDDDDVEIEEPVVHSIQTVQPASPQAVSKARLVTVAKRAPPRLPPRNPNRSGPLVIDASSPKSPLSEEQTHSPVHETQHANSTSSAASSEPTKAGAADVAEEDVADVGGEKVASLDGATEKMDAIKLEDHKAEQMDSVKLDDDEDEVHRDPWAKVEEMRKQESMPGGFY
ncbi:hypothetical protein LTR36_004741 [Oleoguttula mirabilis]|uniref:Ysc84 actin-binding domain-containing protein n=1 Tax=Oleoguttula mirabilis TaxID=1507867 RepID=A0AAV9JF93_9PEZI|nr:hypothetical protein LTR36_004741 [Oleoguttula mirabilis]